LSLRIRAVCIPTRQPPEHVFAGLRCLFAMLP
jgi:hypothetical protein